ncbi:MAG: hypothetical protein Ta2D_03600 [Rickettsiales bacterium]|nr:MAG: hypothetical protein Ta2D_03600 [Rickettsiales bacterium]
MKKITYLFVVLLLAINIANALPVGFTFGVRGGAGNYLKDGDALKSESSSFASVTAAVKVLSLRAELEGLGRFNSFKGSKGDKTLITTGFLNGYVNVFSVPLLADVEIGGGVGNSTLYNFREDSANTFAWNAGAVVSFSLLIAKLDVGYRYVHSGEATYNGIGGNKKTIKLNSNDFYAGIRFGF